MKLSQVNEYMAEFNKQEAPGSECGAWQEFVADCYAMYGCAGYSDKAYEVKVSAVFADYWCDIASG